MSSALCIQVGKQRPTLSTIFRESWIAVQISANPKPRRDYIAKRSTSYCHMPKSKFRVSRCNKIHTKQPSIRFFLSDSVPISLDLCNCCAKTIFPTFHLMVKLFHIVKASTNWAAKNQSSNIILIQFEVVKKQGSLLLMLIM
jgi:hypothetical protein